MLTEPNVLIKTLFFFATVKIIFFFVSKKKKKKCQDLARAHTTVQFEVMKSTPESEEIESAKEGVRERHTHTHARVY